MKKVILLLLPMLSVLAQAQVIDDLPQDDHGKVYFSEVVRVDSVSKEELFLRSKQFFIDVFKSVADVPILTQDKEAGIVIAKAFITFTMFDVVLSRGFDQLWYSIKIQCKEGRYKYEIYDMYFKSIFYMKEDAEPWEITNTTVEELFDKRTYFNYSKKGERKSTKEKYKNFTIQRVSDLVAAIKYSMSKPINAESASNDDW